MPPKNVLVTGRGGFIGSHRTCVQGTLHVLECAREVGARLFIASTSEDYGDPTVHPQDETCWGNVKPIACSNSTPPCSGSAARSPAPRSAWPIWAGTYLVALLGAAAGQPSPT